MNKKQMENKIDKMLGSFGDDDTRIVCIDDHYSQTVDIYTVAEMKKALLDLCWENQWDIPSIESFMLATDYNREDG